MGSIEIAVIAGVVGIIAVMLVAKKGG